MFIKFNRLASFRRKLVDHGPIHQAVPAQSNIEIFKTFLYELLQTHSKLQDSFGQFDLKNSQIFKKIKINIASISQHLTQCTWCWGMNSDARAIFIRCLGLISFSSSCQRTSEDVQSIPILAITQSSLPNKTHLLISPGVRNSATFSKCSVLFSSDFIILKYDGN